MWRLVLLLNRGAVSPPLATSSAGVNTHSGAKSLLRLGFLSSAPFDAGGALGVGRGGGLESLGDPRVLLSAAFISTSM